MPRISTIFPPYFSLSSSNRDNLCKSCHSNNPPPPPSRILLYVLVVILTTCVNPTFFMRKHYCTKFWIQFWRGTYNPMFLMDLRERISPLGISLSFHVFHGQTQRISPSDMAKHNENHRLTRRNTMNITV
jgi:hypothetical protein